MIDSELSQPRVDNRILIVADAHLGGFDRHTNRIIEQDFIHLLGYAESNCNQLIILGDLYDYWMEYPGSHPDVAADATAALTNLSRSGFSVLYITGNHDNWMRSYFSDHNIEVEHEYRIVNFDNLRVLLHHGDGFISSKWEYRRPWLHRILRNPGFVSLYQRIFPEKTGLALMKWFSKISSLSSSKNARQKLDDWCRMALQRSWADVVICGHHHQVRYETNGNKRYINTGNFFKDRSLILYANNDFHPVIWDGKSLQIQEKHSAGTAPL